MVRRRKAAGEEKRERVLRRREGVVREVNNR